MAVGRDQLAFLNHVHQLNAAQGPSGGIKILKPEHRSDNPLDGPVILFDDIVQIFDLANFDD